MKKLITNIIVVFMLAAITTPVAADSISINIESPAYTLGNIHGQNGWSKTGLYDVVVDSIATFPNATLFGFGNEALRLSNTITSGSFGDQTFTPGLVNAASENTPYKHYEASFVIGTTQATQQPGLFLSVSPDDGNGSRMSYVGFDDRTDGIHVIFYDVTNPGPYPTIATFNQHDVATIDRTNSHTISFAIDFVPGPANDIVKLYVDSALAHTGTTWEDYYRYDSEQTGNGNVIPATSKLLFREGGSAAPSTSGFGYLVDSISQKSELYPRSAEISSPTLGENVYGSVNFTAFLNDDDVDSIQWAVRQGTCAMGADTIFGNVDGHSDVATINQTDMFNQTFSFTGHMSAMPLGMYCFVYNPVEDAGETNIRLTQEFILIESPPPLIGPPTTKEECKDDGWIGFNNPTFKNQGDCVSYVQSNGKAIGNEEK